MVGLSLVNRREHNPNKITHIPQTTDNPLPHNAAEGTNVDDGATATGGMSGMVRSDTPGRVFLHLSQQQGNSQVLHQSPKHTCPHSKDMCQRVPRQLELEPLKTIERRQRAFQDLCRKTHSLYAHHIHRHTRGTQEETMAEAPLRTPMHPPPD
jgi:hypothetical protein